MLAIELAERGWVPDGSVRWGIRRLLDQRLRQQASLASQASDERQLAAELRNSPMVVHAADANAQHYEVPAGFFQLVLGPRLKYSCGYWPEVNTTLAESESAMLQLTTERADLQDGMRVLELGCGWGSLTLWMAEKFPRCQVTAVSNSSSQKRFIDQQAATRGLKNVDVVTANIASFAPSGQFDRVVSVEMFEHVRNHALLLSRIANWMRPDGSLFVHVFCHRQSSYLFETEGAGNWMGRHFFTGGMMPSANWLRQFDADLRIQQQWQVNGRHYQRTCEAWLQNLDHHRDQLENLFQQHLTTSAARRQLNRWRIFFLACAELFGYRAGEEWFVSHYVMRA